MEKLVWKQAYCIGIDKIDNEHKIFFDLVAEMQEISKQEFNKNKIDRFLRELVKYAEFHFFSEENLMIDIDYPEKDNHHKQHQDLLEKINIQKIKLERKMMTTEEFTEFLFDWFLEHTTEEDGKITEYIKSSRVDMLT